MKTKGELMNQSKAITSGQHIGKIGVELTFAILGSIFLALLSQIAIPLPFTPIPMTLQTLGVFLLGGTLGGRRAAYAVLAYLTQGCCGLPVFAGGVTNPLWFLDYKAGYLIAFVAAAFVIGKMLEKRSSASFIFILFSIALGQMIILGTGMAWLSLYVGINKAFMFGVVPFLSGAVIKSIAGVLFIKSYIIYKSKSKRC
jgi:biotin transport system substrate-specific component